LIIDLLYSTPHFPQDHPKRNITDPSHKEHYESGQAVKVSPHPALVIQKSVRLISKTQVANDKTSQEIEP
jgi:hypothetical protein